MSVEVQIVQVEEKETVVVDGTVFEVVSVGEQGPPGPPGPVGPPSDTIQVKYPAATALSGHIMTAVTTSRTLEPASNDNPAHALRLVGMTVGAADSGAPGTVQTFGEFEEPSWSWTPDQPVYLGKNGRLTQEPPAAPDAVFSLVVGVALAPTRIFLAPNFPIFLTQE